MAPMEPAHDGKKLPRRSFLTWQYWRQRLILIVCLLAVEWCVEHLVIHPLKDAWNERFHPERLHADEKRDPADEGPDPVRTSLIHVDEQIRDALRQLSPYSVLRDFVEGIELINRSGEPPRDNVLTSIIPNIDSLEEAQKRAAESDPFVNPLYPDNIEAAWRKFHPSPDLLRKPAAELYALRAAAGSNPLGDLPRPDETTAQWLARQPLGGITGNPIHPLSPISPTLRDLPSNLSEDIASPAKTTVNLRAIAEIVTREDILVRPTPADPIRLSPVPLGILPSQDKGALESPASPVPPVAIPPVVPFTLYTSTPAPIVTPPTNAQVARSLAEDPKNAPPTPAPPSFDSLHFPQVNPLLIPARAFAGMAHVIGKAAERGPLELIFAALVLVAGWSIVRPDLGKRWWFLALVPVVGSIVAGVLHWICWGAHLIAEHVLRGHIQIPSIPAIAYLIWQSVVDGVKTHFKIVEHDYAHSLAQLIKRIFRA